MQHSIVFDTETTGLVNGEAVPVENQPRIIEFAAIKFDEEYNEIGRLEFICDPGHDLSDEIVRITGLKTQDVAGKPPFERYYSNLVEFFIGTRTLYAHNLSFDLSMLRFELERLGKLYAFPWPPEQICTVEKSFSIKGHRLNLAKLHGLATGVDHIDGAHRAMVDVEALLRCVKWMDKEGLLR